MHFLKCVGFIPPLVKNINGFANMQETGWFSWSFPLPGTSSVRSKATKNPPPRLLQPSVWGTLPDPDRGRGTSGNCAPGARQRRPVKRRLSRAVGRIAGALVLTEGKERKIEAKKIISKVLFAAVKRLLFISDFLIFHYKGKIIE
uniref:Uncharacterized protein n=1 Tax=Molossus molossus TaxID=27622 RepID=A0A7J8JXY2_MOLMO|nr:hypothetical protein HJG59_007995 [Molossus molossus]